MCQLIERSFEENLQYMKDNIGEVMLLMKDWDPEEERRKMYGGLDQSLTENGGGCYSGIEKP